MRGRDGGVVTPDARDILERGEGGANSELTTCSILQERTTYSREAGETRKKKACVAWIAPQGAASPDVCCVMRGTLQDEPDAVLSERSNFSDAAARIRPNRFVPAEPIRDWR